MSESLINVSNDVSAYLKSLFLTYKSNYQNTQKDPKSITENVHEDYGDESDAKSTFTLSLFALLAAQELKIR